MLKDKNKNKNKNQSQYALTFEACNSGHKIWTNLVKGEKTMKKNSQQKKNQEIKLETNELKKHLKQNNQK
jgi:hypothetical protein